MPASMSAFEMTWFNITSVPSSSRFPLDSRPVIFTLASVSPSASMKLKSDAWNAYVVSSSIVTSPVKAVGGVLAAAVTSMAMV